MQKQKLCKHEHKPASPGKTLHVRSDHPIRNVLSYKITADDDDVVSDDSY